MSAEIRIQLSKNSVRLRPGERADLTLTVQNMGEIVDRYHITVQGGDPSWTTLSRPELSLFPQGQDQVQVTVGLPSSPPAGAGRYELSVQVTSEENPAERSTAVIDLEVVAVPAFDVVLRPQRQSGMGEGTFRLEVVNQGNADLSTQFEASDPEEGCLYVFEPPLLVVPAGEERPGQLRVLPKAAARRGQAKSYPFTVTVRLAETPEMVRQVRGEWEHLPRRRSVWPIVLAALAGLAAVAAVLILALRPALWGRSARPTEVPAAASTTAFLSPEAITPTARKTTRTPSGVPTAGATATPSPVPMADLRVLEVTFDRTIFLAGADFEVEITIENAGDATANPFLLRVLLLDEGASCPGPGETLIEDTMPTMEPGTKVIFPGIVSVDTAGQHTLCIHLDATGQVSESDEGNNTAQRTISVTKLLLPTILPIIKPTLIFRPIVPLPTPTP